MDFPVVGENDISNLSALPKGLLVVSPGHIANNRVKSSKHNHTGKIDKNQVQRLLHRKQRVNPSRNSQKAHHQRNQKQHGLLKSPGKIERIVKTALTEGRNVFLLK